MSRVGQLRTRSKAGRLVAATLESLEEKTVSSGFMPQDFVDRVEGCLKQAVLVLDQVLAVVDDPLGGCVGLDAIMSEKGAEELDGSGAAAWSALCPTSLREDKVAKEFDPKRDQSSRSDILRIVATVVKDQ